MTSFDVPGALVGERIDRTVALLTGRSRAEVGALVKAGRVLLDGHPATSAHARVTLGQVVSVDLPDDAERAPVLPEARAEVEFTVVHADEDVIVVDKPSGVVVHPGAGHSSDTLVSGLLSRYPDLAALAVGDTVERPGIVHRLDKETSGLLVVARTTRALESLSAQLADRSMGRTYLAAAKGLIDGDDGVIEAPIGRSTRDPKKMAVRTEGRYAKTTYRVLARFREPEPMTYLECVLTTGRTHQIRVHLGAIGHPVVGDRQYGGSARAIGLHRPFLHAARLRFTHPGSGAEMEFSSELPQDLAAVLDRLER